MLSQDAQSYILEQYNSKQYTHILEMLDILAKEMQGQHNQEFYTQNSIFLLRILPGIATNTWLFDRAIKHLSRLKIDTHITRSGWLVSFRKIFTDNTSDADNNRHTNAVKCLLSSSENFSCRLGLDILKIKSFPLDFLIEQLGKVKLKQPTKVLELLAQYAPQISNQRFFSESMQELIHVVIMKSYSRIERKNDQYLENYLNQVAIMAQMLIDVTPENDLIRTHEYCRKLLNNENGAQIFAIKFLTQLGETNSGKVMELYDSRLLAKFELLFVPDESGEVVGMSILGLNLLNGFVNDKETMKLINQAVLELTDSELSAFLETLKTYPGVNKDVLIWVDAWKNIVLKNKSATFVAEPIVKRIRLQPEEEATSTTSFPARKIFDQNNNQLQQFSLTNTGGETGVLPTMKK